MIYLIGGREKKNLINLLIVCKILFHLYVVDSPQKRSKIETPATLARSRTLVTISGGDKLKVGLFVHDGEVYINLMNPVKDSSVCLSLDMMDSLRMSMASLRDGVESTFPIGRTDAGVFYLKRDQFKRMWLTSVRVYTENFGGDLVPTKTGVSMIESTWKSFVSKIDEICKYLQKLNHLISCAFYEL